MNECYLIDNVYHWFFAKHGQSNVSTNYGVFPDILFTPVISFYIQMLEIIIILYMCTKQNRYLRQLTQRHRLSLKILLISGKCQVPARCPRSHVQQLVFDKKKSPVSTSCMWLPYIHNPDGSQLRWPLEILQKKRKKITINSIIGGQFEK